MNKAYLRKLDKKFERLFKGSGKFGALTNTSKSVYSFEGEVLSEEDDEYNTDSSFDETSKYTKSRVAHDHLGVVGELENFHEFRGEVMVFPVTDEVDQFDK